MVFWPERTAYVWAQVGEGQEEVALKGKGEQPHSTALDPFSFLDFSSPGHHAALCSQRALPDSCTAGLGHSAACLNSTDYPFLKKLKAI